MTPMPAALSVLLLACAPLRAAAPRPDWVTGESAAYPKAAYLVGVAEGPTQDRAGDKARAEISKIFGVTLTARTQVSASATIEAGRSSESQYVSDDVRSATGKFLEGVEVVDSWQDGEGAFYSLAVLNREHALKVLADKLAEVDRVFKESSSDLERAEGKFAALRAALKMQRAAKLRRQLNNDYRILSPDGKGLPAADSAHDDLERARRAVAAVTVSVAAAGDEAESVAARVVDSLGVYGIKTVEQAGRPDVLIELSSEGRRLPIENLTWFTARGRLKVKMSYGSTGEVFKRFEQSGDVSVGSPGACVRVCLTRLATRAAGSAYQVLTSPSTLDD